MVAKKSNRNQKKQARNLKSSQTGSAKDVSNMTIQERKQNIQKNAELMKGKVVNMFENVKDNTKGLISLYVREVLTQEEIIEKAQVENKKLKSLLTKHKIKF